MRLSAGSKFTDEYLDEFETELKNIIGCQSGVPRGNRLTKKRRVENFMTLAL
jgi:hypothetical protein